MEKKEGFIACQGKEGAFSHLVSRRIFPQSKPLFFSTFDEVLKAVEEKKALYAVLPLENSSAGRVADLHPLLCETSLQVVAEHFHQINHHLLALPQAKLEEITLVKSHVQALSQCQKSLKKLGVEQEAVLNTAMAAQEISLKKEKNVAAVASIYASELYGLKVLKKNIQDNPFNVTRFWILARPETYQENEKNQTSPFQSPSLENAMTSFIFWVKNQPAVLYKCLGGFATNNIDLLRLESYVQPKDFFSSAGFLVDVRAHPESPDFQRALDELSFFAKDVKILGSYSSDSYRETIKNLKQGN